jgi:hypothetical protein
LSGRAHHTDYDEATTTRCERALVTLLGDIGPWSGRVYLAGGLAPRYLVGQMPEGSQAHVGTTDVDLIIGLTIDDETAETYRTLQNNLEKAHFTRSEPSFRWTRAVDGVSIRVEFLCETDAAPPGRIFKPTGEFTGSKLGALNVRGAQLARDDFIECDVEAERLDEGGKSTVTVRVANVLPYVVLKIFAFQDRHENKDAYDLVFTLLNADGGPTAAGRAAGNSPVARHPQAVEAMALLSERFEAIELDGPTAYASFLAIPDDTDEQVRFRREAVATVREFRRGFDGAGIDAFVISAE